MSLFSIHSVKHPASQQKHTSNWKKALELLAYCKSHPLVYMLVMLFELKMQQNTWQQQQKRQYGNTQAGRHSMPAVESTWNICHPLCGGC